MLKRLFKYQVIYMDNLVVGRPQSWTFVLAAFKNGSKCQDTGFWCMFRGQNFDRL